MCRAARLTADATADVRDGRAGLGAETYTPDTIQLHRLTLSWTERAIEPSRVPVPRAASATASVVRSRDVL